MPAPFTIVTLKDRDGDEFPIRLQGHGRSKQAALQAAQDEAREIIKRGDFKPTGGYGGLSLKSIEEA